MINEEYIRIGVIIGVHGLTGRLKVLIISDNPERFTEGNEVFLKQSTGFNAFRINRFAVQKKRMGLLQLEGISDRDTAFSHKGEEIFIHITDAVKDKDQLETGSFYYFDIIGCQVYVDGTCFGIVENILEAGAGEVLEIIDQNGKKVMVPFVESMVNTDRISEKRLDVSPVEGLFDI